MGRKRGVEGLITALLTPFDASGRVSERALIELVHFQLESGCQGLYPCGTTGLGPLLQAEERKRVAEVVVREAAGRVPVIVQVGSADTSSTVELARHAEKVGADAVASLTPYYYRPGDNAVVSHFEKICNSISIPLFAYNIPQFTGNNLRPSLVAGMARKGTIKGIKDSSRDFLQLLDIIQGSPEGFTVVNGTEEYALYGLMAGTAGQVSGKANAFPELLRSLVAAFNSEDYESALEAQRLVTEVRNLLGERAISSYYEVLKQRGIDCGKPRGPFLPLDKAEQKRIKAGLTKLGLP